MRCVHKTGHLGHSSAHAARQLCGPCCERVSYCEFRWCATGTSPAKPSQLLNALWLRLVAPMAFNSYNRIDKSPSSQNLPANKSVHAFDVEDDSEATRLLTPGLEKETKLKYEASSPQRRKLILIVSSVAGALALLCVILGLVFGIRSHHQNKGPAYICPDVAAATNYAHTFFVVGDWGRGANHNQQAVAKMMGVLGQCYKPSYVISTGDNFYHNGLKAADDPYFTKTFTQVYTAPSLQVPWYAVLGNHDYGELDRKQLTTCSAPTLDKCPPGCCYSAIWQTKMKALDDRWNLQQGSWKETFMDGQLDIIFIDTTPLVGKYHRLDWAVTPGGIYTQNRTAQIQLMESLLASSTAPWKLVVGHHPVHSYGEHCLGGKPGTGGDCVDMQFLGPLMNKHKVAAYFCGHEHDLQLIKAKPGPNADQVYYVVSGGGADIRTGEFDKITVLPTEDDFLLDNQGFVAGAVLPGGDQLRLDIWARGDLLKPAYSVVIDRPA